MIILNTKPFHYYFIPSKNANLGHFKYLLNNDVPYNQQYVIISYLDNFFHCLVVYNTGIY